MRLSEAILLGSTVSIPVPGAKHGLNSREACALGMGENALNGNVNKIYLWLGDEVSPAQLPCGCSYHHYSDSYGGVIAHIFDGHIFDRQDWTLEKLVDYVRSVEPEEAPEQAEVFAENRTDQKIAAGDTRRQG